MHKSSQSRSESTDAKALCPNAEQGLDSQDDSWFVYMILTHRDTLYTGIAKDVDRRFSQHKATFLGKSALGAKYFRGHEPLKVVYKESCLSHSIAAKREIQIKKMTKKAKLGLISTQRD